jgi:hypothetical protein
MAAETSPTVTPVGTDDDSVMSMSVHDTMEHVITTFGYPAIRLVIALLVVWMASGVSA